MTEQTDAQDIFHELTVAKGRLKRAEAERGGRSKYFALGFWAGMLTVLLPYLLLFAVL